MYFVLYILSSNNGYRYPKGFKLNQEGMSLACNYAEFIYFSV